MTSSCPTRRTFNDADIMAADDSKLSGSFSDYGSDFTPDEEEILSSLLVQPLAETDNPLMDPDLGRCNVEDDEGLPGSSLLEIISSRHRPSGKLSSPICIRFEDSSTSSTKMESQSSHTHRERSVSIEAPYDPPPTPDLRSPLERFRTKPKKPLSVSDLISPSWCELQYWYVLTKHGKKRRTPAMRQGSAVHKTLEDQVHTTVSVDIQTKEDAWGLRIWNTIQGLKTLRETGMTRELAVWGVLGGQVINGVIDELSYTCPDRELEASALSETEKKPGRKSKSQLAPDQATITEFLSPRDGLNSKGTLESNGINVFQSADKARSTAKIYICDVKTRSVRSLPKKVSFRPTLIQLSLYHRLLSDLATGNVDAQIIFDRYELDSAKPFTDHFIAQIGNLNEHLWVDEDASQEQESGIQEEEADEEGKEAPTSTPSSTQDSLATLISHNSLVALWQLLLSEFKTTFPLGADSLGNILKAEYRDASTGDLLGDKTALYDKDMLTKYLEEEMEWWLGKRPARGVAVEEAFKCGSCEFNEECEWRKEKIDEQVVKMRSRSRV